MNARKKYTPSDFERLDRMTDDDIDYSDIPELDESELTQVTLDFSDNVEELTLAVDHDVLEYFKEHSDDYQLSINRVLKAYVNAVQHKKDSD